MFPAGEPPRREEASIRTLRLLGLVFVLLTCTLPPGSAVGSQGASMGAAGPAGIAVDVTVEPMDAARTQFLCRVLVKDVVSGDLIAGTHLQALAGRPTKASSFRLGNANEVGVVAQVDEGGSSASYSVEYRKGGVLVAAQKGAISLSPRSEAAPNR